MTAAPSEAMVKNNEWRVDEASRESFPASDPPAWGSSRAAPSKYTAVPPELKRQRRIKLAKRIALGVGAAGVVAVAILGIRYLRAR